MLTSLLDDTQPVSDEDMLDLDHIGKRKRAVSNVFFSDDDGESGSSNSAESALNLSVTLAPPATNPSPLKTKAKKETLKTVLQETSAFLRREVRLTALPARVSKPKDFKGLLTGILGQKRTEAKAQMSTDVSGKTKAEPTEKPRKISAVKEKVLLHLQQQQAQSGAISLPPRLGRTETRADRKTIVRVDVDGDMELELIGCPNGGGFNSTSLTSTPKRSQMSVVTVSSAQKQSAKPSRPSYRPASIDLLNASLQARIREQSTNLASDLQRRFLKAQAARRRARAEAQMRQEAQEKGAKECKEDAASGRVPNFSKFEAVERPDDFSTKRISRPKVVLSEDESEMGSGSEDGSGNAEEESEDEDLDLDALDLEPQNVQAVQDVVEEKPKSSVNLKQSSLTAFLGASTGPVKPQLMPLKPLKAEIVKTQKRFQFIDDEADDEDDELEGEKIDEAELEREMMESRFIALEGEGEDAGAAELDHEGEDVRAVHQRLQLQEDQLEFEKIKQRLRLRDAEDELFLEGLANRYMDNDRDDPDFGLDAGAELADGSEEPASKYLGMTDAGLRELVLDPRALKRKRLNQLDGLNRRTRRFEPATDEFIFPAERKERAQRSLADAEEEEEPDEFAIASSLAPSSDYCTSETEAGSEDDADESDGLPDEPVFEDARDPSSVYDVESSGIQQKVEAMLNAEAVDLEETNVQATESLDALLASDEFGSKNVNAKTTGVSLLMPKATSAQLRMRLAAEDANAASDIPKEKVFRGFSRL